MQWKRQHACPGCEEAANHDSIGIARDGLRAFQPAPSRTVARIARGNSLLTDVSHAEVARDVEEIRDIDAALQRLAAGTYGVCARCEKSIHRPRLEAYPTAKRCLPCQKLHERSRLQTQAPTLEGLSGL